MRTVTIIVCLVIGICAGSTHAVGDDVSENTISSALEQAFVYGEDDILGVRLVVGNDFWLPGEHYEDGDDWLALVCSASGCALEPALLAVAPDTWQGHYDDEPTSGQRLRFGMAAPDNGDVVGWFQVSPAFAWLKQGDVATYHSPKNTAGFLPERGALEAAIPLPGNETARLVPLLITSDQLNQWQSKRNYRWPSAVLQLRADRQRQLLPGEFGSCSGLFHPRNYLLWAGDIDRDDEPDYLVSYVDAEGPVHLFLSSAANEGQLVGLGGIFHSSPFGGECDGPAGFLYFDASELVDDGS